MCLLASQGPRLPGILSSASPIQGKWRLGFIVKIIKYCPEVDPLLTIRNLTYLQSF